MYLYDLLKDKKYDDFIRQTSLYLKKTSFDLQIREYFINQLSPIRRQYKSEYTTKDP